MKRFAVALLLIAICCPNASAEITHITCGGRGDRPCTVVDGEWWEGGLKIDGCDRGLYADWIGYCRKRAWWGPCISYQYPWRCKTDSRTNESWIGGPAFTNQYLAQIELGRNEPINWINLVGTHNAFNNASDGYVKPNQRHSMTEQLDSGVRVLFLDVHQEATCNCLKLSHAQADGLGDTFLDRHLIYGFREIREWLRENPDQFVILRFETYFEEGQADDPELANSAFEDMLRAELGPYLLPKIDKPTDRWPTLAEMRANGTRAIAISDGPENAWVHRGWYPETGLCPELDKDGNPKSPPCTFSSGRKAKAVRKAMDENRELPLPNTQKFTHVEEDSLRYPTYGDTCTDYSGLFDDWTEGPGMICPLDEACEKGGRHSLYDWCPLERIAPLSFVTSHGFSTVSLDRWRDDVYTQSGEIIGDDWVFDDLVFAGQYESSSCATCRDNLAAAMSAVTQRWYDAQPDEEKHFACSYLREGNPSEWFDPNFERSPRTTWRITAVRGPWENGWRACADEFGAEGLVFSVPANSWQNEDLKALAQGQGYDIWLAYRDVDEAEGRGHVRWDIDRGFGGSQIRSEPKLAREGQSIRFETSWSREELAACWQDDGSIGQLAANDTWDFGDNSPAGSSESFVIGMDEIRFKTSHTFQDNLVPYVVSHRLPTPCPADAQSYAQIVMNALPEIRVDCSDWTECDDTVQRDEIQLWAGEEVAMQFAYFDAGVKDSHTASIQWGDGATDTGVVVRSPDAGEAPFGHVSASHTYLICDTHRVDVALIDDDGGTGMEYQMVRVDEPPPEISCPPDIVEEATSPDGAEVNLGKPNINGGICTQVSVFNNAPNVFALGSTIVTWTVQNAETTLDRETGEFVQHEDHCTQEVRVVDTTPPTIERLSAMPAVLWSPSKKMQPVTTTIDVVDIVDASPVCELSDIQVNQTARRNKYEIDYEITGPDSALLLADREGSAGDRVYSLVVTCSDFSGNVSSGTTDVLVPHDMRAAKITRGRR